MLPVPTNTDVLAILDRIMSVIGDARFRPIAMPGFVDRLLMGS
jgi:hypothetical protein